MEEIHLLYNESIDIEKAQNDLSSWEFCSGKPEIIINNEQVEIDFNLIINRIDENTGIKNIEPIKLRFSKNFPFEPPTVIVNRNDFPITVHLNIVNSGEKSLCLFRGSPAEWYTGKTFTDFLNRIKNWFDDASIGNLEKTGDPFEEMLFLNEQRNGIFYIDENKLHENLYNSEFKFIICSVSLDSGEGDIFKFKSFHIKINELLDRLNDKVEPMLYHKFYNYKFSRVKDGIQIGFAIVTKKIIEERFSFLPKTLFNLINECKKVDINLLDIIHNHIKINLLQDPHRNNNLIMPLLIGIKRPKEINNYINKDFKIEWLPFVVNLNSQLEIQPTKFYKVRQENYEEYKDFSVYLLSPVKFFTQSTAIENSDRPIDKEEKELCILGCGALGSKVTLTLAREGFTKLILVDGDILLPHNMARHTLFIEHLAFKKVISIKESIKNLYWNDLINDHIKTIPDNLKGNIDIEHDAHSRFIEDIIRPLQNKKIYSSFFGQLFYIKDHRSAIIRILTAIEHILGIYFSTFWEYTLEQIKTSDFIFDFTTSNSITEILSRSKSLKAKIASFFLCPTGSNLIILLEGNNRNPRLDDLEVQFYTNILANTYVKQWFTLVKDIHIEESSLGCRIPGQPIPDDLVSIQAGMASYCIRNWIDKTIPQNGAIGIHSINFNESNVNSNWEWITPEAIQEFITDNGWSIRIATSIIEKLYTSLQKSPQETVGVIMGKINMKIKTIYVTYIIYALSDCIEDIDYCERGKKETKKEASKISDHTGKYIEWLGDWHTHPGHSTEMSIQDNTTFDKQAKIKATHSKKPFLMIIVNKQTISCYVNDKYI